MSKPEYVQFCNRIHLLELQPGKGDMDEDKARKTKQTLLVVLARNGRKSAAYERPRRRTMARTRRRRVAGSSGFVCDSTPGPEEAGQQIACVVIAIVGGLG